MDGIGIVCKESWDLILKEKEETDFSQRDKIMKKAKPLHKHLYKNLHKGDTKGDVNESSGKTLKEFLGNI